MKIQDLKKLVLLSKKESKELSQAYAAIMKKVESVTIGSKNTEVLDESKLILKSAQKELKELLEAKSSGAPFNEVGIDVCEKVISELQPKMLTEDEIRVAITSFVALKANAKIGEVMGHLKKTYGDTIDMAIASKLLKGK